MSDEAIEEPGPATVGSATIQDRLAAFEMLDRMTEATQAQKCLRLDLAGFSRKEIAEMLMTNLQTVRQSIYSERQKLKKKSAAKATSSSKG
jgi:DNA-directed RNA polymerase specialized sigma24 family protein